MLSNNIFYHQLTRKIIVAFGSLFSNIKITREDQENIKSQTINIPISMAPKEKWLLRIEQEPNLDKRVYTTIPRMSFEILGMNYDPTRRVGKIQQIKCLNPLTNEVSSVYSPVPYNYSIGLYILTKTMEDGLQIVEQIFPYFSPEYTMKVRLLNKPILDIDIPIVLNSSSVMDEYDGMFDNRRFVTWTLNFTIKSHMFLPVKTGLDKVILDNIIDVSEADDSFFNVDINPF